MRILDALAPGTSRHPWIWDRTRGSAAARAQLLTEERRHPFAHLDLHPLGLPDGFAYMAEWEGRQALWSLTQPSRIHPARGWIITKPLTLEERGVIHYPAYRGFRPGLRHYLASVATGRTRTKLDVALSLRTHGETNYFHFLNDLIGGRLRLADAYGIDADTPTVISSELASQPMFEAISDLAPLRNRRWIVQGKRDFVEASVLYFGETCTYSVENLDHVRDILGIDDGNPEAAERFLVTRAASAGRTFQNQHEVEQICGRYGFQVIDTGEMTLPEQIAAFSNARYVIGIHGSSLTNLLFRRNAPLGFLEIFPSHMTSPLPAFFFISRVSGFDYRALMGRTTGGVNATDALSHPGHGYSVHVEPERLAGAIENLLEA